MHFEAGRFHRQSHNAQIDGAVFHALQNFVAEIAVDADLHVGKRAMEPGENFRQYVEAGGLVRADGQNATGHLRLIGHGAQRFLTQR